MTSEMFLNLSPQSKGDEEEPAGGAVRPLLPRILPAPLPALHQRLHSRHRVALKVEITNGVSPDILHELSQ